MTDAHQPLLRWASDGERPVIEDQDPFHHLLDRPDVALTLALLRNADAVPVGREFVDRQALNDARERAHIVGQLVEQGGVAARRRHRTGVAIEIEQRLSHC